ncbi:MAG: outer membrane beta-barrel protein [Bacteroidetes bacterium]|nr:outer membrane beta-barrel protein [Bacteroidota bacterium]
MMKRTGFLLLLLLTVALTFAQTFKVDGIITDQSDGTSMPGATLKLVSMKDTTNWKGTATDADGKFEFTSVANGSYKLRINYTGYSVRDEMVFVRDADKHLGALPMNKGSLDLKDVNIVENAIRVEQKGDTAEYNAKAYKTNPDATTEDLITKMPGITSEKGTLKAHGEEVKKVTVDGKDFFGEDATLAVRNLPAEVVDRVQVYDRMSDFAQLTGFDDGRSQKSMNLITRQGKNNGVFGKVYAGYGYLTDHRYSAGATVNWFKGNRRLSFVGMSNNVNQQNFSMQDLLDVTGSSGGGMGGGGRPGGGGYRGGGAVNNFMVGQQGGISTTHAAGINYTDMWGKKLKVSGSYFFNYASNSNNNELTRQYFNAGDSSTIYKESNNTISANMNHRANFRLEYTIDSMNKIIFNPKASFQKNKQTNSIIGENSIGGNELLGFTQSTYFSNNFGYNISGDLTYQHKFKTLKRTLSLTLSSTANNRAGNTTLNSFNQYFTDSTLLDQIVNTSSKNYVVSGIVSYTEPAGKQGIIQLNYSPSYTWNKSDKETFNYDTLMRDYMNQDTTLSNKFDNTYMTQRGGVSYRFADKKISLMAGLDAQYAWLDGTQLYPIAFSTSRRFFNMLPNAMLNYKFSEKANIRIYYRASTSPPSLSQLQNVIDNSNPLLLSTGNPDLKQNYSHFGMVRFGWSDTKRAQTFFAFFSTNYTHNYIGNSTYIAKKDTLLNDAVILYTGSQLTQPVNLKEGSLNLNSFFTYGLPIKKIKCNLNLNAGFSYSRNPGMVNNEINRSNTYIPKAGLTLSSNISEQIDFSINYSGSYNIVKNTLQKKSDNNYFTHFASARFNWLFWKGFVFNTGVQNTLYAGIAQGFNQNIFLWDASFGYKFFKDKSLEVKVSGFDLLNQNSGISRSINETYIEDSKNQVLRRYLMLTVTYTIRQFKKS